MARPRPLPLVLVLALPLAPAAGCGEEEDQCLAECLGVLEITFADGREEFDLDVQGTGFSVTARCPRGAYDGNVYGLEIVCDGPTVQLLLAEADFPEELSLIVDGERWDETVAYETSEICGSTCESGSLTLD